MKINCHKFFLLILFTAFVWSVEFPAERVSANQINHRRNDVFYQGKPSLKRFTSRDGLPTNSVMSIERDGRGYVWFGTQEGAAVYNGHAFSVINMPNRAVSNYIFDVLTASDESVWFGTDGGGLHRLKDGSWASFDTASGLAHNAIRVLLETKSEAGGQIIWVGMREGLSKFENDAWTSFTDKEGLPDKRVRSLLETLDDAGKSTLWIGTYGGLAVWRDDEKKVFDEKNGLPGKTVFALLETKNEAGADVVWAGTDKGLAKYENGSWQTFENLSETLTKSVRALGKSSKSDGTTTVWVGFDDAGIAYFDKGKWFFLDETDGLPNTIIFAFAETGAPDGSVWISNLAQGVSRFERSNWHSLSDPKMLPNKIVFDVEETVSETGEKAFWFATYGGGIARFQNGVWKKFGKDDGLLNDFAQTLYETKDETGKQVLYAGTEKGLLKFQNDKWEEIPLVADVPLIEVWNIRETKTESGKQELLISASYGLFRKSDEAQIVYDKNNGLPDRRVRDALEIVSETGEKTLWVATYSGGLAKMEKGVWTVYNDKNGFPTNKTYTLAEIKTENSRQLWVGTGGGGIVVFDLEKPDEKFRVISSETGGLTPSDTIYKIFQDEKKRIYVTTNKGVARITPVAGGEISEYDSYIFTTEDGLPENECVSGAGFVDDAGRVWVGTVGGAAVLDLSREMHGDATARLFLENVLVNGEKRSLAPNTALPYSENNIVFEYVMPTNFRESATVYRTQLAGLEEKPTDWTHELRREFTYLPDGEYVFKVWGKDAGGNVSQTLEIPFRVRPAWWQTWWAFLLYLLATALIVALIAYAVYRNRYLRMLEIERVRTRIATDLHDDVGTSLSKISILSEVLSRGDGKIGEEEKESLAAIANTSRKVVGSMSDMVWSINPNRDNLRDTIQRMRRFAVELLMARDIEFSFDAPDDEREIKLDVDLRRQLYLVFKESLNNAVKHSGCTRVEIELKPKRDSIILRVSDNGRGFEPEENPEGNGLTNMQARTAEIGGKFEILSKKGEGTSIILQIPRRSHIFKVAKST